MNIAPNVLAAKVLAHHMLPRVRARFPEARLSLVGRSPNRAVLALGSLAGVDVTGEVPDIRPWLWRAQVFACPMTSGTGIKNKLLEALACGVPSVATPLACQGMDATDGRDLLVADADGGFAEQVVRLLDDASLRGRLSAGGRSYVVEHHSWDVAARRFERLYEETIAER
jgi:glycosyltransferase involved in cell wall biosynthesis